LTGLSALATTMVALCLLVGLRALLNAAGIVAEDQALLARLGTLPAARVIDQVATTPHLDGETGRRRRTDLRLIRLGSAPRNSAAGNETAQQRRGHAQPGNQGNSAH